MSMSPDRGLAGLVLAAGAGSRLGVPKALVRDEAGSTWLARTVSALADAGVTDVSVVVGADARAVRAAVPTGCQVVEAVDWHQGMSASLSAGLRAVAPRLFGIRTIGGLWRGGDGGEMQQRREYSPRLFGNRTNLGDARRDAEFR